MYDPKLTKPPQDFSKGIPKAPVTPKPADDQEIDLDTWDDMVADRYKVPKSLMRAIASQESGGNVNAKSPTGVVGKYQVTKATAQSYGLDRDDPWQQSVAAAKHLRKLFDETDGADDDEKWLGAVGKYYGGNNAVRNGELAGSSIDGVSNPAEHVRRVAQKWGEIRRSERGTQPQAQPQQPAPRGTSSADIIPPEQRLTIPEGQSLNIGTGQIGKRAPVQGAAARRPNDAVEGAQRALSFLQPEELAWEAKQITDRAKISPETNRMRPTLGPGVPSPSAITGSPQPLAKQREAIKARGFAPRPMPRKPGMLEAARNILSPQWVETPQISEAASTAMNAAAKGGADLGAGLVRLGERAAEKTLTGGPLSGALDLLPDSMAGPYKDYRKAVQDRVQAFGQSRQATKGAQTIGRAADTLAPISNEPTTYDPRKAEFYSRTLPQAAGSLVPLVGASLMTGGAAAAPFLAGAAMNAEQTYQETMARTGNEQLARQAADTGAAIGALEGFGLGRMLNKFGIKQALAKRALQVVEEAGQEGASQWLNNVNMRLRQIDPNRSLSPLDEEVLGNALLGAIMGGAAQVGGRMISGPEAAQGKILREGGQPVSRDAAAQEPFAPTVRQPSPQETADADIRGVVKNYVAEMSALEKQPRTPERDAQMAQMREDYRALRNYIRDPQSLSDEQLQAILGRQQVAPEVTAEPMAQETVAPGVENAPTAEVAPVEPSAPRPSGYVDVARTAQAEAADAERAGNWEAAVTRYAEQHEALKQYQRELRKTGTPEQKAEIARQISAADLSRRRAGREVLRQERIANAPTKGLPRERASTPKAAEVAPTGELLSSTVNPEGGVPKLPTQEVDFTRLAAEQSAQKPPKPAKRLLSRIAELGGIDERYAGELQDAADARRIGIIRKRAQMSPDIMARQLASEGYDVDPEDLNTLWEAARRDIVQGERPVNTAELTRRGEGTAELEQRLTAPEVATEFTPDTADLRQVREFGRELVEPGFTQEPPTAPLRTQGLRQAETAQPAPQTDIERRAFLRQATAKGEYGKLSEYSRLRATENRSLSGSDELRKLLDLPEMPPYRNEQSGKTTEWSNAAQQTMDALAELAGFNKKRSSEMGLEGLRDAWRTLTRRAKERGTPVSDDLRDRFIHTAQSYQIGFLEPYMALHTSNETVSRALREIEDIYAKDGTLTIADGKRLYNTLRNEFVKAGLTEHYFRKTYWPAIKQAAGVATSGTRARRAEGTGRDVQVETPRETTRQQAPATQESAAIKSGDRVQWEQRGRTETAFVSRIKGDTAYVDYGTGDEVAVPVKRLRKADVSPADAVRQIKPNGGLVPMVQLKRALGADADAAILAAAERGEIALHRHNQPSAMTAEEKANAVHDAAQGDRGWYIGASVREGATFRQQEPPLKAQMRTRADVESSPAFRQWFGESKVVGEDGKPMVVYHGTFGDFDTFEQTKDIGYHFGTAKAARDRLRGLGKKMASGTRPASGAASTGAYYLSIQNPLEIRDTTGDSWQFLFADLKEKGVLNDEDWRYYNGIANKAMDQALIETEGQSDDAQAEAIQRAAVESSQEIYEDMRQMVLDAGYDGFKYTNRIEGKGSTSWIALKPEQIKSATGNRGTFSAESPKITERRDDVLPQSRSDVESSPAFRRWFGESKAVNRYGEPLIVYHGTISETPFDQFDASRIGSAYEGSAGFWFTDTPETAASYANIEPVELSRRGYNLTADPSEQSEMSGDLWQEDFGGGRRILGAYLKLENPKIVNASEFPQGFPGANRYVERIKNDGKHDGVIIRGVGYDSGLNVPVNDHYIVFSPNQIKSATGNKGTFSTESPNISERRGTAPPMPERYTIRQVAQNAQMRFRPAANRPGSLYLNDWGGELMNRLLDDVYGTTTTDTNFTMDVKDARNLLDHLRAMAAVDTLYSQEERANVREAADQFERAIQAAEKGGYDVAVLTRKPNEKLSQTKVKVRHEATHASQSTIASDLAALTGGTWVDSQPKAKQIRDALARRGYAPQSHDFEAAAFIASGDESVFGMSVDEGAQFLASYFDEVIKRHGKNALDRFGAIAPRYQPTLERARNEAQIRQTQTQSRAALDIGEPGQTGSTGRSGRGIQAEGRFGTEETPRRPQTGLLRGVDLEKVKQRQAGGGGAMPPRPPKPPREGGGRREEQSGEPPKQSKLRRAWDQAGNALSLPRALMASLDLSAPLRQGAILTLPPSQWGRAMKATAQMIKSLNTKQFERFVGRLQSHPDRPLADEAGLHLSNKEEDFSSEWTQKIPLVKQSEQAYTSYLDSLRLDTFSRYNKAIEKAGLSTDDAKAARKAAAEWINVATGRGSLGESFERAMPVLSKLLFSPRYTASRFQVLNPYTYAKNLRTPGGRIVARNQMADLVQFLGVTGATLALASMAGAEVDDDLQSSDFGKIRVGNTRYDIFAGLLQPLRMMYRVGRDLSGAAVGKESAKGENAMEIAGKFARSKLAPVPSYFVDAVTRKDFIGRDFDPKRGAVERVLPLMWRDFYEAVQREGSIGAAKMTPGFFGIGVQDYEKRPGALGLTGRSRFVQEMRNAGLDYKFAPPLKDEPASLHRARAEKIEQWLSTYGEKLVSHPRWGQLSAEEKKTAISNLRRRVSENANLKQPSTSDFDAGRIIAGVRRAATEKPKSDRKKIYAEP